MFFPFVGAFKDNETGIVDRTPMSRLRFTCFDVFNLLAAYEIGEMIVFVQIGELNGHKKKFNPILKAMLSKTVELGYIR